MNKADLADRGLRDGDLIDLTTTLSTEPRRATKFTVVEYNIPRGSVAGYYPELNVVIALEHYDRLSGTPSYKSVPVFVTPAA